MRRSWRSSENRTWVHSTTPWTMGQDCACRSRHFRQTTHNTLTAKPIRSSIQSLGSGLDAKDKNVDWSAKSTVKVTEYYHDALASPTRQPVRKTHPPRLLMPPNSDRLN